MPEPHPYTINVPQEKVIALKQKLAQAAFPNELDGAAWSQGPPLADMRRLVKAWQDLDWRACEEELNKHENFQAEIEVDGFGSLKIHFVHQKDNFPEAIPLLFVHGWPGSFLEVFKIKDLLKNQSTGSPRFHVVAPTLPNFGFSEGVSKPGFGLAQYAETCHKLMLQLGYNQYVTQAGDWGSWITRAIGFRYPESCKASHHNMIYAKPPSFTKHPILALQHAITPYTATEQRERDRASWFDSESRGYSQLQSTKPQSLAYSLADSPVGLLAWIYEKLHDWTDDYPWTDAEVLRWISVYWFSTAGPAAPQRIYYEFQHEKDERFTKSGLTEYLPKVKLGFTYNPKELDIFPRAYGRTLGNVVYEAENEHGGHFYAHEHPEWLVRDLHAMFGKGGGAYGVIEGKTGYPEE